MTSTHLAGARSALVAADVQMFVPSGTAELFDSTETLAEVTRAVRGATHQIQRGVANLPRAARGLRSDSIAVNPDGLRAKALDELDAAANFLQVAEVAVVRAHEALSHLYCDGFTRQ